MSSPHLSAVRVTVEGAFLAASGLSARMRLGLDDNDVAHGLLPLTAVAAFALVPAGAHLAELSNKMKLGAIEYQTVQQIYRGWELFGVVVFGAVASSLALTIGLRGHPTAFTPALVAFLCIVGTQVVFWTFTFPVNRVTVNWTVLPDNWVELRARWEYSHVASAGLNSAAVIALIVSLLRYSQVR